MACYYKKNATNNEKSYSIKRLWWRSNYLASIFLSSRVYSTILSGTLYCVGMDDSELERTWPNLRYSPDNLC
jgi:hypothetical protein